MSSNKSGKTKNHKRGPAPVIIPKHISDWIKETSTIGKVNNWKVGGGLSPYR
jgi:hypothetical protein